VGVEIIIPKRQEPIARPDGTPEVRTHRFFEAVANAIGNLPDQMSAITDVDEVTPTAAKNAAKLNELLAALRTAGYLAT
jgi:hypothetical protein